MLRAGLHPKGILNALSCKTCGLMLLLLLFASHFPPTASAIQQPAEAGVLLEQAEVSEELQRILDARPGISFLVLPVSAPEPLLRQLRQQSWQLLPMLEHRYTIADDVGVSARHAAKIDARLQQLRRFGRAVGDSGTSSFPAVGEVILAEHPNLLENQVSGYFKELANRLSQEFDGAQPYVITNLHEQARRAELQPIHDYGARRLAANQQRQLLPSANTSAAAVHIVPRFGHDELRQLQQFFNAAGALPQPGRLLFREADFLYYSENVESFDSLLSAYGRSGRSVVALPPPRPAGPRLHFSALLLVMLWLSFGLHYFLSSSYRRAVKRYFFSHTFFVEDVLDRHVRFAISALLVLVQTGLMWGLMIYTSIPALVSGAGLSGLSWHYPIIEHNWTLLVIFFIAGTAFNLCCIIWLGAACLRRDGLVQAATLQMWPMHLGLLFVTAAVPSVAAGAGAVIAGVLLLGFILLNLLAFLIAALHFSRRPSLPLPLHWLATVVLYTGLLTALGLLFFYGSRLSEVFYLAASV